MGEARFPSLPHRQDHIDIEICIYVVLATKRRIKGNMRRKIVLKSIRLRISVSLFKYTFSRNKVWHWTISFLPLSEHQTSNSLHSLLILLFSKKKETRNDATPCCIDGYSQSYKSTFVFDLSASIERRNEVGWKIFVRRNNVAAAGVKKKV